MALEIEYDETTGKIGTLPEPLQKMVDGLISQKYREARQTIEKEFADKTPRGTQTDPLLVEKLKTIEEENHRFKIEDAERQKRYDEAEKLREERERKRAEEHQKELDASKQEILRREARIRDLARSEIKIAAKKLGARDESLPELAALLGADLDLDADLQPFVKGSDGQPAVGKDGTPVTIEGYVQAYLDKHAHHRVPTSGTGGGARGGASFAHLSDDGKRAAAKLDEARERVQKERGSPSSINEMFEASRAAKRAAAGGR